MGKQNMDCIQVLVFTQWVKEMLLNGRMLKFWAKENRTPKDVDVINKIEFSARNLTSNAGLFLLLEHAGQNGIFDLIDHDLVFENGSTNKIKMNHIKTMLCGNLMGIDKLERLKLLQSDPLINEFDISIKEPETVSRFLGKFSYKTTQILREIHFKIFRKMLRRSKLKSITIDIDSSVVNVEGHQEGSAKGYNPKKLTISSLLSATRSRLTWQDM